MLTVVAEVAQDYLQLRGLQRRLAIANDNLWQEDTLELTHKLRKSGFNSELDVSRAQTQVSQTQAQIAPLRTGISQIEHAIATLMGRDAESLTPELDEPAPIPTAAGLVTTGVPSICFGGQISGRRSGKSKPPAQIGAATADYFPKFSLTGDFGFDASQFKDVFNWESRYFIINPGFSWRLLDFGATAGKVAQAKAAHQEALLTYQNTVLTALREVEDAWRRTRTRRIIARRRQPERCHRRRNQSRFRMSSKQGLIDFLQVLDAQRQLLAAEDELALSEQAIATDLVALYRALGGGWEVQRGQYAMGNSEISVSRNNFGGLRPVTGEISIATVWPPGVSIAV